MPYNSGQRSALASAYALDDMQRKYMIILLRILAFLFTLIAVVIFVSLNSRIKVIDETKDYLISELERNEPNDERVSDMKNYLSTIEDGFKPIHQIIAGVASIILSFTLSGASRHLKRREHIKSLQTTRASARV